jgi:hypothetical protein
LAKRELAQVGKASSEIKPPKKRSKVKREKEGGKKKNEGNKYCQHVIRVYAKCIKKALEIDSRCM